MSVKEWINREGILSVPIINLICNLSDLSLLYFWGKKAFIFLLQNILAMLMSRLEIL